ncbi:tyrosine-type recombinase/integrase [Hyphococcus sp.]
MTDRWLRSISVEEGRAEFADAVVRGLRLRVSPRSKKWSVVTRIEKKQKRIPIGDAGKVGLLDARKAANEILDQATDLTADAIAAKALGQDGDASLKRLCEDYVARMKARGQPSYSEYERALARSDYSFCRFMSEKLGRAAKAAEVTPRHVSEWLRLVYDRAPSHARHCRAYLHAAFEWALEAEFDYTSSGQSVYRLSANPVSATPAGAKSTARNRVLSHKELQTLWRLLPEAAEPRTVVCIRLIMAMGGIRITEVCRSEWSWYDKNWLTLPKTKNAREHALPLTQYAVEQFRLAKALAAPETKYLFPHQTDRNQSLLVTSIGKVARRLIEDFDLEPFQMRDLRRSFKTHLLDGEYVEEREIDIWHNHGQNSDVARKHYTFAEYKALKIRVAGQIDGFLKIIGV